MVADLGRCRCGSLQGSVRIQPGNPGDGSARRHIYHKRGAVSELGIGQRIPVRIIHQKVQIKTQRRSNGPGEGRRGHARRVIHSHTDNRHCDCLLYGLQRCDSHRVCDIKDNAVCTCIGIRRCGTGQHTSDRIHSGNPGCVTSACFCYRNKGVCEGMSVIIRKVSGQVLIQYCSGIPCKGSGKHGFGRRVHDHFNAESLRKYPVCHLNRKHITACLGRSECSTGKKSGCVHSGDPGSIPAAHFDNRGNR